MAQLRDIYGLDYRFSIRLDLFWAFLPPSSPVLLVVWLAGSRLSWPFECVIGTVYPVNAEARAIGAALMKTYSIFDFDVQNHPLKKFSHE